MVNTKIYLIYKELKVILAKKFKKMTYILSKSLKIAKIFLVSNLLESILTFTSIICFGVFSFDKTLYFTSD